MTLRRPLVIASGTVQELPAADVTPGAGRLNLPNFSSAPSSPVVGEAYWDTTLGYARLWDGTTWEQIDIGSHSPSKALPTGKDLRLAASAGSKVSCPDTTALSITGDITLGGYFILPDWVITGRNQSLVSKWPGAPGQRSYLFHIDQFGVPTLFWTTNGTAEVNAVATAVTGIADGQGSWVWATLDVDNGSAQRVAKFYKSALPWYTPLATVLAAGVQIGTTVTTAGTTSIFDGTAELEVANSGSATPTFGRCKRAFVVSGYDGTITATAADVDFTDWPRQATSYPDAIGNIWTITPASQPEGLNAVPSPATKIVGPSPERALSVRSVGQDAGSGAALCPHTPDHALVSGSDLKMLIAPRTWHNTGSFRCIASKIDASPESYGWYVRFDQSARAISWIWSPTGTAAGRITRSATIPDWFIDGDAMWLRIKHDIRSADYTVSFYYSFDGDTWVRFDTETTAAVTSIFTSPNPIVIGAVDPTINLTQFFDGNIYYVEQRDGDGRLVFTFDAMSQAHGAKQWGDGQGNDWSIWSEVPSYVEIAGGLYIPGVTGHFASCPDSAALRVTGDITLGAYVTLDDATPPTHINLITKYATPSNQRGYFFQWEAGGTLRMGWSETGSSDIVLDSTIVVPVSDGEGLWVWGTVDVDDGAGQKIAKFWYSYQPEDTPVASLVGILLETIVSSPPRSIFASNAQVEIGTHSAGTATALDATIGSVFITDGYSSTSAVAGTVLANPRFDDKLFGTRLLKDAQGNLWRIPEIATTGRYGAQLVGGSEQHFVGPRLPIDAPERYKWTQTGLGPTGIGVIEWIEDGAAA